MEAQVFGLDDMNNYMTRGFYYIKDYTYFDYFLGYK